MKKIYVALLCAFALLSTNTKAQAQLLQSCNPPAELLAAYDDEIRMMAISYAWDTHHPDTAQIQVSPALYDFVADGLAAIYNSGTAASDSVFNKYCVHDEDDGGIFYDKFYVRFNHTYPWTMAWKNGLTITGNSQVDSIFSEHQLQVDYYTTMIGHAVYVKAPVVINLVALDKALKQIPGIYHLEYDGTITIGTRDRVFLTTNTNNSRQFSFRDAWMDNDTLSGGLGVYTWNFKVDANCNVVNLGSSIYKDYQVMPLPTPQNCNLFLTAAETISSPLIQLFPNPTSGTVHIQTKTPLSSLKLYNATGSCVLQQPTGAEMNISHLPTGLYYFSGTDAQGKVHTQRLVKN